MTGFYEIALGQARNSFRWAIAGSVAGVAFFMAAIAFLLVSGAHDAAIYSAIGGGVVEVIAGINFVLYSKATTQLLASIHRSVGLVRWHWRVFPPSVPLVHGRPLSRRLRGYADA